MAQETVTDQGNGGVFDLEDRIKFEYSSQNFKRLQEHFIINNPGCGPLPYYST